MKPEDLFRAIGAADDELLERSRKQRAVSKRWIEWGALAACVCIVAAVSIISVKIGSNEYEKPETEETAQTEQTAPPESRILPPKETPSPAYYDDSFADFYVDNPTAMGLPMTYDEVMNMLLDRPGELDSFYLIETVRLLSLSECAEVEGIYEFYGSRHSETTEAGVDINPAVYMEDDTIYEVVLKKDLITGEETNERCYMLVRHMGNMDEQQQGDPLSRRASCSAPPLITRKTARISEKRSETSC